MPSLVRILLSAGLLLSFSPAMAAPAPTTDAMPINSRAYKKPLVHFIQSYDPCTDGRFSDGRPHGCDEILRMLDNREHYQESRERYDPCKDGSVSDGRPRGCREIMRWLRDRNEDEDWRPRRPWK
ncbi:hypothetical protein [Mesorhizobium sp. INR15]|uniref:hypothetical protein n=1 Tax=Mesorhizobium sp. INR15 TaxID=2654248 RepID=UPI0018967881|nr:hypothetical protein [Mesorhizobium sp. INR15]QPC92641.1 hypothetical protein GA829_19790 [Mesorhizobium sp. INR15]